jgi:hypothetical protein
VKFSEDFVLQEAPTKIVWVNSLDEDAERLLALLNPETGVVIYNAPRPIPGDDAWEGKFRHGIFYAIGTREQFGKSWDSLDAWPVQVVSNAEIEEKLRIEAANRPLGDRFESFVQKRGQAGYKELAQFWLGMPYKTTEGESGI